MLKNHFFVQTTGGRRYWHCYRRITSKCKARLRFDEHFNLVFSYSGHTHNPPSYFITDDGKYHLNKPKEDNKPSSDLEFELIERPNRKPQVVIDGYMFYQSGTSRRYWYCCKRALHRCRARVHINEQLKVIFSDLEHTHAPNMITTKSQDDINIKEEFVIS